jgi:2-polyprenyl-6-methoxyphenol hydroxylase-like FAD-dependent oxidoreductase
MVIPTDPSGDTLAWGINTGSGPRTREEWSELEKSGEACRMAKEGWEGFTNEPVRSLIDGADDKTAKIWTPWTLGKIDKWTKGRCCLIGDAAHAMPPNGMGSALAFEDVALMTKLFTTPPASGSEKDTTKTYSDLFNRFQAIRQPRVEKLREGGKTAETLKQQTNPWVWAAKKWGFRGYFWWNSGVLKFGAKTEWDVEKVDLGW